MTDLAKKRCLPCEGGVQPLSAAESAALVKKLSPAWSLAADGKSIAAEFGFKNYFQTTAFVNAVAYVAHREDHHPDISFGYKTCTVRWWTHASGGLTENDFICAAKTDLLLKD